MIIVVLFLLLVHSEEEKATIASAKESTVSNITCFTTEDCLRRYTKGDWCKRGVVCVKSYCHIVHSYPCDYHKRCNPETQQCEAMTCSHDKDCDDGKYCNGKEVCDRKWHKCLPPLNPVHCISGECNETLKKCVFTPIIVNQWHDYKQSGEISIVHDNHPKTKVASRLIVGSSNNGGFNTAQDDIFKVQDTTNSSTVTLNSTEVTIIICLVIFFIGVILMLLFFAVFTRAGVHETIYVG